MILHTALVAHHLLTTLSLSGLCVSCVLHMRAVMLWRTTPRHEALLPTLGDNLHRGPRVGSHWQQQGHSISCRVKLDSITFTGPFEEESNRVPTFFLSLVL